MNDIAGQPIWLLTSIFQFLGADSSLKVSQQELSQQNSRFKREENAGEYPAII